MTRVSFTRRPLASALVGVLSGASIACAQSTADLWDISDGAAILGHSPFDHDQNQGYDARDALGGQFTLLAAERGNVIFDDTLPLSSVDWIEWRLLGDAVVASIGLHFRADVPSGFRGISSVRLFYRRQPTEPWTPFYENLQPPLMGPIETNIPLILGREFRAEFTRRPPSPEGFDGPRIIELDGFGVACARINQDPQPARACPGGDAQFTVIPGGTAPWGYTWYRDGVELLDGPTGTGSTISGAFTASLTLHNVSPDDQGQYTVRATNYCASAVSQPAALTVCVPDCNCDAQLNLADFGCFQTSFAQGNMAADCNRDQELNLADFGCFQTKFALGCP